MESRMGVKDAVRALLEGLPESCSVDDVIDRLYELLSENDARTSSLTRAQREELDRRLDRLERGETRTIPWDEVRRELERDE